jgi:hypothetical protein
VSLSLGSPIATDIFRLALNHWQLYVGVYEGFVYRDLLYYLVRKFDSWSCIQFPWRLPNERNLYDAVASLLSFQDINDGYTSHPDVNKVQCKADCFAGFDDDCPLRRAILQRSEQKFHACLTSDNAGVLKTRLLELDCTQPLASWPRGIEVLMTSGLCNVHDILVAELWREPSIS